MMAYSAAGIQMVLIIGIFVFAGRKLDSHFQLEKPWWTLGLAIFGVIISMTLYAQGFFQDHQKINGRAKPHLLHACCGDHCLGGGGGLLSHPHCT
jgi:hypothetical protein